MLRVAGAPETWAQATLAAVLAAGEGAVVSFRAAAHLWGLAGFREAPGVEITMPTRWRTRLAGVVVHDSEVLGDLHVARRTSIPVTSVGRTLCGLTAICWSNEVGRALDDALRRRDARWALESRGFPGTPVLRSLLPAEPLG